MHGILKFDENIENIWEQALLWNGSISHLKINYFSTRFINGHKIFTGLSRRTKKITKFEMSNCEIRDTEFYYVALFI